MEAALPDNLQHEFKLLQKMQGCSFTAFIAKMDERFGRGQPMVAQKKIEKVELPSSGKIRTQELKTFEVDFTDALKNIRDMGLEEARRLLICKFPDWMRILIMEEENWKNEQNSSFGIWRSSWYE